MSDIALIVHNVRSSHNVGSLLRTAEGLGINTVYLTGYTPYPSYANDSRLPHISAKLNHQIHKTALGAEKFINWRHQEDVLELIDDLRSKSYTIAALEQTTASKSIRDFKPPNKLVLIVGNEIDGLEPDVLRKSDIRLEIPMFGEKESFNVAQASAMALYHMRFLVNG